MFAPADSYVFAEIARIKNDPRGRERKRAHRLDANASEIQCLSCLAPCPARCLPEPLLLFTYPRTLFSSLAGARPRAIEPIHNQKQRIYLRWRGGRRKACGRGEEVAMTATILTQVNPSASLLLLHAYKSILMHARPPASQLPMPLMQQQVQTKSFKSGSCRRLTGCLLHALEEIFRGI